MVHSSDGQPSIIECVRFQSLIFHLSGLVRHFRPAFSGPSISVTHKFYSCIFSWIRIFIPSVYTYACHVYDTFMRVMYMTKLFILSLFFHQFVAACRAAD